MRLLSKRSPFFESYFSRAADPSHLDLPEDKPTTFAIVAQWVYSEKSPLWHTISSKTPLANENHEVFALYRMANKFCLWQLQDQILASIVDNYVLYRDDSLLDLETLVQCCHGTNSGSPLRLFAADALAWSFIDKNEEVKLRLKSLLIRFPDFATGFIEALGAIVVSDEDNMATRTQHDRYLHWGSDLLKWMNRSCHWRVRDSKGD